MSFMLLLAGGLGTITSGFSYISYRHLNKSHRLHYIAQYSFPNSVKEQYCSQYHMNENQYRLVEKSLRQYFGLYALEKHSLIPSSKPLYVPSKAAEDLWFLFSSSPEYAVFSQEAFNEMFYFIKPINWSDNLARIRAASRNAYFRAYHLETYELYFQDNGTPLMYAIDKQLDVKDGYTYSDHFLNDIRKYPIVKTSLVKKEKEIQDNTDYNSISTGQAIDDVIDIVDGVTDLIDSSSSVDISDVFDLFD